MKPVRPGTLRVGVAILPTAPWHIARTQWVDIEKLGFSHAWTYDHLTWRDLASGPWYAALPTLTAAALATTRVELGALVFSPNFRSPVALAKELATLADFARGRLVAALGAGGTGDDATVAGDEVLAPIARADRLEDFVAIVDELLRTGHADHRGKQLSAHRARSLPTPDPKPTLGVAANSRRSMQIAALRADMWITDGGTAAAEPNVRSFRDHVRSLADRFDEACQAAGREPGRTRRLMLCGLGPERPLADPDAFLETCQTYAGLGFTDIVVHYPRQSAPFAASHDALERIAVQALPAALNLPVRPHGGRTAVARSV